MNKVRELLREFVSFDSVDMKSTTRKHNFKVTIGAVIAFVVLAAVTLVVISGIQNISQPVIPESLAATPSPLHIQQNLETVVIHVVGDVPKPGIYEIPQGSRLVDAVMAAGGVTGGAEACGLNLARNINDGEQIEVIASVQGCPQQSENSGGLVSLNESDASGFDALPGIGPTLSERIIAWRDQNGSFTAIEELNQVSGIGDKLYESIKDLVTL